MNLTFARARGQSRTRCTNERDEQLSYTTNIEDEKIDRFDLKLSWL